MPVNSSYNNHVAKKKVLTLEWNKLQRKIAKLLIDKENPKTQKAIAAELHCEEMTVYKVNKAIKAGLPIPPLDDNSIANAPDSKVIPGGKATWEKASSTANQPPNGNPQDHLNTNPPPPPPPPPPGGPSKKEVTTTYSASEAAFLKAISHVMTFPLTPDIFWSYMMALKHGYKCELPNWIRFCCMDVWGAIKRPLCYYHPAGYKSKSAQAGGFGDRFLRLFLSVAPFGRPG
jgi:hypothetical protein